MAPDVDQFFYTIAVSFCTGGHFYLLWQIIKTLEAKQDDWRAPREVGTYQCLGNNYAHMVWFGLELIRGI